LSVSEFHSDRPIREAQGSPKGRVTGAISFGSFSFSQKKMNKKAQSCQAASFWLRVKLNLLLFFSPDR
jgi:hypothetical protein